MGEKDWSAQFDFVETHDLVLLRFKLGTWEIKRRHFIIVTECKAPPWYSGHQPRSLALKRQ